MKKLIMAVLALFTLAASASKTQAQVSVQINIGSQPAWGPTGYDYAPYYFLPEVNCYYDVARSMFIIYNSSARHWQYVSTLPARYGNINLYNTYKVVVNRQRPYENFRNDKTRYAQYKNMHNQPIIRDSKEEKYFQSKGHPQHQQWEQSHGNNNSQPARPTNNNKGNQPNNNQQRPSNQGKTGNKNQGNRTNKGQQAGRGH